MESNSTRKIIITAVITFVVTSVIWVGIGVSLYHFWTETPPPLKVTVTHPDTVKVGDTFTLKIDMKNSSTESVSLDSIDLYDKLLDGFTVLSVDPKPDSEEHRWGFSSYYFQHSIPPLESFTFKLKLQADQPGYWSGDIDCCTPFDSFVSADAVIEVSE